MAASADDPFPFRCPNARGGDDIDHVLAVVLDPSRVRFPVGGKPNPFIRYRALLHSYHVATARMMSDAGYVGAVAELDSAVAGVDGRGFVPTPFAPSAPLSGHFRLETGHVWVKDETGNVSGSHKARHLMGLLIHLTVAERLGLMPSGNLRPDLAIASCGNAALAAAVLARAGGRRLRVFVPTAADVMVTAQLNRLGAEVTICPRETGTNGDPTYHHLQQAVRGGALPFTCQGPDNGLTIEGGKTLAYEMISELATGHRQLDRLFVQVGGGALASACVQGFQDAVQLGALGRMPRIHAVQTLAVHPLKHAYEAVTERILTRLGREASPQGQERRAEAILAYAASPMVAEEVHYAATHRSEFMRPWKREPRSVAAAMIDDETYDWLAVTRGMIASGGYPIVVSDRILLEANRLARETTGINVDPTGSAGLAGLLQLYGEGQIRSDEQLAVLFTGVQR
jgi:threonine synthase